MLLCCAVLCCARDSTTNILVHYKTVVLNPRGHTHKLALANSACLQAMSSGMHEKESTAKHGTTRHSTAPHAGHDTARHSTALRRAVELAKLNGAGGGGFVLSDMYAAGCDTEKLD